ncbi:MAG: hypothetical protein HYS98_00100 [Deltaproteobacteria bacterium]|nr:hypothetical protein [Deltaproteobacteria bacterium]
MKNVMLSVLGVGLLLVSCGRVREDHLINLAKGEKLVGESIAQVSSPSEANPAVKEFKAPEKGSENPLAISLQFDDRVSADRSTVETYVSFIEIDGKDFENFAAINARKDDQIQVTELDLLNGVLALTVTDKANNVAYVLNGKIAGGGKSVSGTVDTWNLVQDEQSKELVVSKKPEDRVAQATFAVSVVVIAAQTPAAGTEPTVGAPVVEPTTPASQPASAPVVTEPTIPASQPVEEVKPTPESLPTAGNE